MVRYPTPRIRRPPEIRSEALAFLDGRGEILDTARELSRLLARAGIRGVIVGGVAVVLHGHLRTTKDVDVLADPPLAPLGKLLEANGFEFNRKKKEFVKRGVPVRLVLPEPGRPLPGKAVEIEGVTVPDLAYLISMKLRTGTADPLRAQDLADVIGLIRALGLKGTFASRVDKDLRPAFRKLAGAIFKRGPGR